LIIFAHHYLICVEEEENRLLDDVHFPSALSERSAGRREKESPISASFGFLGSLPSSDHSDRQLYSLLTTPFAITEESFWNINHFEDLAKYVFWTFNKSFLLKIIGRVEGQRLPVLVCCRDLLVEYPVAYREQPPADADRSSCSATEKVAEIPTLEATPTLR